MSSEEITLTGFIVHGFIQNLGRGEGSRLAYLGRATDGTTFAAVWDGYRPHFYVRKRDEAAAVEAVGAEDVALEQTDRTTMDGEPVMRVSTDTVASLRRTADRLRTSRIRTYESDVQPADVTLIDSSIRGSMTLSGPAIPGRFVNRVFQAPECRPADWDPVLETLALDIETNPLTDEILAISLVSTGTWGKPVAEVHLWGKTEAPGIVCHDSERALLERALGRISEIDPDIITGWNVIDFDFQIIDKRLSHYHIPFAIARSPEPARFLPTTRDESGRRQNAGVACHGRQVLDGLRLVRYGPERFDNRKLGSVAQAVLGIGKTVEAETSREKIATLLAMYQEDPVAFCTYCRTDSELVLRILEKTGLLNLTLKRCRLTGISLNRAWTSIPAFEFLYMEAMHKRGLVAPTLGIDQLPQGESPGGAILKPVPGVHQNVLVFDFKSLYPSLIRTFGIDPLAYVDTEEGYAEGADPPPVADTITAPNGARFARTDAILPLLIDSIWENRELAKQENDQVASYVYKIIMNSFYGVLGTSGCRFAGSPLAGAITGFGQYILHWARDRFRARSLKVIYGDTDSLFVLADSPDTDTLFTRGDELCAAVNEDLARFVEEAYEVESKIELEFEKVYTRFYLPRIRHTIGAEDSDVRGRAKGYAGLPLNRDGSYSDLDIKGMEAIRSDWTAAAARLQIELLTLLFQDKSKKEIETHIRSAIRELQSGSRDEDLLYTKRLRKPVASYSKTRPPHVQAAALLPRDEQEGFIEYVMTTAGPQPPSVQTSPLDYPHYIEKQIRPIAEPICEILGIDTTALFDPTNQLSLF